MYAKIQIRFIDVTTNTVNTVNNTYIGETVEDCFNFWYQYMAHNAEQLKNLFGVVKSAVFKVKEYPEDSIESIIHADIEFKF